MAAPQDRDENSDVFRWIKFVCNFIYYYTGLGDCWYENQRTQTQKILYPIWSVLNLGIINAVIIAECMALFRKDLTIPERYDARQFCVAHVLIIMKWIIFVYKKNRIRKLLKKMMVETRELFVDEEIEKAQAWKAKQYSFALALSMISVMFFTTVDAVVKYYINGTPWRVLVTMYPHSADISYLAFVTRGFTCLMWYHIVTAMLASDFLSITTLIYLSFKFRMLGQYFKNLKKKFEDNVGLESQAELEKTMNLDFVKGVKLHQEIIWCSKNVQVVLGNLYSIQLTQSVLLLVNCLAKLVTTPRSTSNLLSIMSFIACMLVLTSVYMWAAGDITFEAADVCDAIFDSGWHLCSADARLKTLVVVAMVKSQVPVVMTAFGVVDLSYFNFIKILRTSYSVFAVFY